MIKILREYGLYFHAMLWRVIMAEIQKKCISESEKKQKENSVPFYVQVSRQFGRTYSVRFMGTAEEKDIKILFWSKWKWRIVTAQELKKCCKKVLRQFLNLENFNLFIRDEKGKIDPNEIITVNGITISADILVKAKKDGFTLSKETKRLIEELYDTLELYMPEKYFLAPNNIIAFKNGFIDLDDGKFHRYCLLYESNGSKRYYPGFLYQLNANYCEEYWNDGLPQEYGYLIWNGIANPKHSEKVNEARFQSFLECMASSFLPDNKFRKLFMIIGPTACGKSTLVAINRAVFGNLGLHLQSDSLMKQNRYDQELRPDLKAAMDRLWLDISETDTKQTLDAVTVKSWTGNDPLTFRKPHSDVRITKVMNCKIWLVTNEFPKIVNYNDTALQDRLVIFDFYKTIAPEERDNTLVAKLTTDENRDRIATYFANRAIDLYRKTSLRIHSSFQYNIFKYFTGQGDPVTQFYDWLPKSRYECAITPATCVSTWDLAGIYEAFRAKMLGIPVPLTDSEARAFENRFAELAKSDTFYAVRKQRFTNGHFYIGILRWEIRSEFRNWIFQEPYNDGFSSMAQAAPVRPSHPQPPALLPGEVSGIVDEEDIQEIERERVRRQQHT
jgi:hypothetical protein